MAFHINLDGDVAECTAQIRCPFGDFETQHYITAAEARAAYEGSMDGKVMDKAFTKKLELNREQEKFFAKKRKKAGALLQTPPPVETGYLAPATAFLTIRKGSEVLGGVVKHVKDEPDQQVRNVTLGFGADNVLCSVPLDEHGVLRRDETVFINRISPEDQAVREVEVSERNMEIAADHILTDCKRRMWGPENSTSTYWYLDENNSESYLNWNPRGVFASYTRAYKSMVDEAVKSGIANPHNIALRRLKELSPKGDFIDHKDFQKYEDSGRWRVIRLLSAIATQNDGYRPDFLDRLILTESFDEGERPYLDYSFKAMGAKVY